MDKVTGKLTVLFQEPFWIGVFERTENGKLSVCKVTFGAEPRDYDVMDFVQKNYFRLQFSPAVKADAGKEHASTGADDAPCVLYGERMAQSSFLTQLSLFQAYPEGSTSCMI